MSAKENEFAALELFSAGNWRQRGLPGNIPRGRSPTQPEEILHTKQVII